MATADEIRICRVLIPDTEAVFDGNTLFTDSDIGDYITAGRGSVLRGAGFAMIAIGNSEALISKVISTQDLKTDGAKVSDSFRKAGEAMLKRADEEDILDNGFYSNIVDFAYNPWAPELTEISNNSWLGDPGYGNGGYGQ